jgi:hypothetical protein
MEVARLYKESLRIIEVVNDTRVETRSNTSIVDLRVGGGEEKGTQCLGV